MNHENPYNKQQASEKAQMLKAFGVMNRLFVSYMSDQIKNMKISFSDSVFLMNIGLDGGISQDEIARSLAVDKAAVARSIKRMVQLDLIDIKRSDKDKRVKYVYLSPKGQELFIELNNINIGIVDGILTHLDGEGKSQFVDRLLRLAIMPKNFIKETLNSLNSK